MSESNNTDNSKPSANEQPSNGYTKPPRDLQPADLRTVIKGDNKIISTNKR